MLNGADSCYFSECTHVQLIRNIHKSRAFHKENIKTKQTFNLYNKSVSVCKSFQQSTKRKLLLHQEYTSISVFSISIISHYYMAHGWKIAPDSLKVTNYTSETVGQLQLSSLGPFAPPDWYCFFVCLWCEGSKGHKVMTILSHPPADNALYCVEITGALLSAGSWELW